MRIQSFNNRLNRLLAQNPASASGLSGDQRSMRQMGEDAFVLPMILSFMVIISVLGLTLMQSSLQANSLAIRHSYVQMAHIASGAAIDFAEEQFEIDASYMGTPEFTIAVTENYRITVEVEHLYFQNPPNNTIQRVRAWGRVYIPEISADSDFAREINASVVRNGEVVGAVDPSDFEPLVWLDASDQNVLQQGATAGTQFIDADTSAVAASVVEQRGADAGASPGSLNFSSSDIELSFDNNTTGHQSVGLRFEDLDAPQGIEINSAYIQFTTDEVTNLPSEVQLSVEGVDSDTAPVWGGLFAVDVAPKTTANFLWEPPEWNVVGSSSINERIDVTSIVKEIIDRPGWSAGNNIAFTITYVNGPGERTASKSSPPQLFVDWGVGGEAIATNDPVRLWQDSSINGNDAEFFSVSTSGSVTPGFLPTNLNPDVWYDAEQIVPADLDASDNLIAWTDLSGNENNALSPGSAIGASIEDNFDPGVDSAQWSNITGGSTDAVCGSSSGNAYRFTSAFNRRAETEGINTEAGGTINFHLQLQASNSGGCNAIESGEDVVLEYSTNGSNWSNIATYQVGDYNSYTPVSLNIPTGAQSSSTRFRWRQVSFSSGNFDHWGIDDVAITANSSNTDQPPSFDDSTDTVNFDGATPEYLLLEDTLDLDDFSVFVVSEQGAAGDSPQLGDGSSLIGAIQDNFDPTQDNSQWTTLTGGSEDTSCGNPTENGFLFDNPFSRFAETIDANTEFGGSIDFDLYIAHQNSGSCNAVESGEDIVLEYSTNGGSSWNNIATYQVNAYNDYTPVSEPIPAAAQAPNTRFRWRQVSFSSGDFDHWGLDNVFVNIAQPTGSSQNITYTADAPGINYHSTAPPGGISNINNGNTSTSGSDDFEVHPINAIGRTITMTFDQVMDVEQASFYNRTGCCRDRISGAQMIFRDSLGTELFAFTFPVNTNINRIDIAPPSGTIKNVASVDLTNFQENNQNFREVTFTGTMPSATGSNGFIEHAGGNITYSSDATGIEHSVPAAGTGFNVWSAGRTSDQLSSSINGTGSSAVLADGETFSLAQIGAVEATNGFSGGIKEVIVYPRLLSTSERQQVEGYLAHKWGLDGKLPSSHPFKSTDPGEDVTTGGSGTSSPPTLETNALAGRSIVRFENQALLNIDLTTPIDSDAVSVFLVARAKPGSASDARLLSAMADADITDLTSSSGFVGLKRVGGSPAAHQFYNSSAGEDLSSVFNNSWGVYTSVISGTQPERLLSNGVENENEVITTTSFNADEIFIAGTRFGTGSGTNIAEVDIAEVVVYDKYIACNAINDLEEYFSLKYGIATTVKSC